MIGQKGRPNHASILLALDHGLYSYFIHVLLNMHRDLPIYYYICLLKRIESSPILVSTYICYEG